ncbi:WGR domain protein [Leptospira borgpetersenii serovar Hardjo-bovis str. Sponselee]|uniref:WGR domain protein n=1 Tax=Leptospira borgpetersenii serovar Hardjo-bovis str. Sponselee TaxID=1303729 RepID=M6BDV4_LEPBO|nr:WGR domain protein [Leptospira borgpetersenii serovar Hardjo-bovis str. Sponselee]
MNSEKIQSIKSQNSLKNGIDEPDPRLYNFKGKRPFNRSSRQNLSYENHIHLKKSLRSKYYFEKRITEAKQILTKMIIQESIMKNHLTYKDDKSDKFWNIETSGKSFTVTYGKVGTTGTSQTKTFDNEEKCLKEAEKLLSEKLKKGYVKINFSQKKGKSASPNAEMYSIGDFLNTSEFHETVNVGEKLLNKISKEDKKIVLTKLCTACESILIGLTGSEEEDYAQRLQAATGLSKAKAVFQRKLATYKNQLKKLKVTKPQNKKLLQEINSELYNSYIINKKSLDEVCTSIRKMKALTGDDDAQKLIIDHVLGRMEIFLEKEQKRNFLQILKAYEEILPELGFPQKLVYGQYRVGEGIASLVINAGLLFNDKYMLDSGLTMIPASVTYKKLAFFLALYYASVKNREIFLQYAALSVKLESPKS